MRRGRAYERGALMKALVYEGARRAAVREVPEPPAGENEVRIALRYCGVCGSDIGIFLGTHPRARAPLILGHEFLGTVEEDGRKFKKGDRVTAYPLLSCGHCLPCRTGNAHVCGSLGLIGIDTDGGMCERSCVDEEALFRVPEGVSDRAAAVIEPLAVVLRAVHQAKFSARDAAVVIGAGPIGMLTGIVLKNVGASKVFISDVAEKRLKIAEELGMIPVDVTREDLNRRVKESTGGEGCDALFECSGSAQAAMEMTELARAGGTICMVSVHKTPHEVNLQQLNFKEQTLVGTRVYTREEFGRAVEYCRDLQEELEKVVTHVVPLRDAARVFDMIADAACGTVKVVVDCRES